MTAIDELLDRFRAGERVALARVLSLIEDDPRAGRLLVERFAPVDRARIIGITGPPGAGKSTLVNALIAGYRERGQMVAVLAFDPSSRRTGGAALGDRVRMMETWSDEGVYVRSLANRGRLGGISSAAFGAVRALDAFGFDVILIETVGVGQGEVDIADLADMTILLQVPGAGDTVQLIKAGVLEIADILVVNKADAPGADMLLRDLRRHAARIGTDADEIPIVPSVATEGRGVSDLMAAIDECLSRRDPHAARCRAAAEVRHLLIAGVERKLMRTLESDEGGRLVDDVASGALSPFEVRDALVKRLLRD